MPGTNSGTMRAVMREIQDDGHAADEQCEEDYRCDDPNAIRASCAF
jgi:hypothetical protein